MKIFLVEDHEIIKEGLIRVFSKQSDFEIAGEAKMLRDFVFILKVMKLMAAIISFASPESNELDIIKNLMESYPNLKILVLSMYADERFAVRTMKFGAAGFLTKRAPAKEFIAAVRKIMSGNKYIESVTCLKVFSLKAIDKNNQL